MESEEDIKDELNKIVPGFPAKKSMNPPQGYFESFPDQVLNRWKKEESHSMLTIISWRRIVGIAAVLTGLCIGGWWFFSSSTPKQNEEISSIEAYQYIHDNIDEFENLIDVENIRIVDNQSDIPHEAIEEYLIEEMHGSDPEDLF